MAQPYDEREARKQYVRQRQRTVFTVTGAVLAVAMIVSLLFFFHVFGLGRVDTPATEPNYGVVAPCAVAGDDGTPATTVDNRSVTVRVLNGTSHSGFGQAVADALQNREFLLQGDAGNYSSQNVERTTIYFGRNAINAAYTVNANFTDAVMVMDDREDTLIDIVLGATFQDLTDTEDVPAAGSTIEDFANCQAADAMTDLPAAIEH